VLDYFDKKINLLYSCKTHSWSLCFHQFSICQVSTAQSRILYSCVLSKQAKFNAFLRYHDFRGGTIYFESPYSVQHVFRRTQHLLVIISDQTCIAKSDSEEHQI